ncbi:hypothetical protein [Mucilaginibacter celer]|uniref:hypothetical protein n=1 Tax=Mucilaginibacter celer TaxID=2305508 RepID=UPI0013CF0A7D|nr:hypothetical protein [Mucilaginibacter celer]
MKQIVCKALRKKKTPGKARSFFLKVYPLNGNYFLVESFLVESAVILAESAVILDESAVILAESAVILAESALVESAEEAEDEPLQAAKEAAIAKAKKPNLKFFIF